MTNRPIRPRRVLKTGRRSSIVGAPSLAIDPWNAYYYAYEEYDLEQYSNDDEHGVCTADDLREFYERIAVMESISDKMVYTFAHSQPRR